MALELYEWKNTQQMWLGLIISWQTKASMVNHADILR